MFTVVQNDKIESNLIFILSMIILIGVLIYLFYVQIFSSNQSQELSCQNNQCKINLYTGIRTCPTDFTTITYQPSNEICTNRGRCPQQYPCIDNGDWIDCSTSGKCPENDENCSCFNFGQCASNISMAWKIQDELYFNFNSGTVNNKLYGIPIFSYADYINGIVACRLDINSKNLISYKYCSTGNYVEDEVNGFICCSYTNDCLYQS